MVDEARRLLVLLLPTGLEESPMREQVESALASPLVVAVEPGRIGTGAMPGPIADGLAHGQARRLRLPGEPTVLVVYHPRQYPLARALLARNPAAQLWYAAPGDAPAAGSRMEELHLQATERATVTLGRHEDMETVLDRFADLVAGSVGN
jgi:hypothetical protein